MNRQQENSVEDRLDDLEKIINHPKEGLLARVGKIEWSIELLHKVSWLLFMSTAAAISAAVFKVILK